MAPAPFNLVNFFFYLERFEVVEFGLVRLELGVEFIFASFLLWKQCGQPDKGRGKMR